MQEEVFYLSPSFPPTVPAFQLATGSTTSFSLEICDSSKICDTCGWFRDFIICTPTQEFISILNCASNFVKVCFAFAQQIHNLYVQFISRLCVLNISLPSENLQATALTATPEHNQLGQCIRRPQSETTAKSPRSFLKEKENKQENFNQNNDQNQFNSTLHWTPKQLVHSDMPYSSN